MVAAFGSNKSEENSNGSVHSQQLLELTASKIAPLLRSGEVSVVNYASVLLKQTAKHSSNLHAFITVDHEAVMAAAVQQMQGANRVNHWGRCSVFPSL